jgi:acetate kinase
LNKSCVLVVNCGSSSIKLAVVEPETGKRLVEGAAERLFGSGTNMEIQFANAEKVSFTLPGADHAKAFKLFADKLLADKDVSDRVMAIGHRVVHGGEQFSAPVIIDEQVLQKIDACSELAPLHNPANLQGIREAAQYFPNLLQVAVFDTAFHQTLPETAYLYAIPYALYEQHQLRRYGFHGTSHHYLLLEAADRLSKPVEKTNLLTVHLGNGCSACAIQQGRSVDTTMGLTPLEGLVMGTRSGDIDPGLLLHLMEHMDYSAAELDQMLNRRSGLLGLSGLSNDMRTLEEAARAGNRYAWLAVEVFCFRLAKAIAAMLISCSPLDALVFSGGIGENSVTIRQRVLHWLRPLGFEVDEVQNQQHGRRQKGRISPPTARTVFVITTDEEIMLARETAALIEGAGR